MYKLDLRNVTFICGDSDNNHYENFIHVYKDYYIGEYIM